MSTNIKTWYDFVLQQMAAESYLDDWNTLTPDKQIARLNLGSNNPNYLKSGQTSATAILPGATRMTATQADYFLQNFTVVELKGSASHYFRSHHATSTTH